MLMEDAWTALWLRVVSLGVSGIEYSSKNLWKGKLRIIATRPMKFERIKAGKVNHDREGLTGRQT
jgi:hypothetical protein